MIKRSEPLSPAGAVCYGDVEAAAARLEGHANRTPVLTSRTVNAQLDARVYFKGENFQRTGSFKFRGAFNTLAQFDVEQRRRGVLAYSSGNHAQAIALAGAILGIPATIVMPEDAPAVKIAATRGYGAQVVLYDRNRTTREQLASELASTQKLTLVPPYDHPQVIAGQGTATRELIEEVGPLDYLVVCCGGGGLLSGSALVAHALSPGCRIVGAEPERADDAARSLQTGVLQTVHNPETIADGARTPSLGAVTFPLVLGLVDEIATVSEQAIVRTMFYLWERLKIVVEPTGALGATALLEGKIPLSSGSRVGVILSGGNVDLATFTRLYTELAR